MRPALQMALEELAAGRNSVNNAGNASACASEEKSQEEAGELLRCAKQQARFREISWPIYPTGA
jgi:hypothetical protein